MLSPEAERLAQALAAENGESVDDVILKALTARLASGAKWAKKLFPVNDPKVNEVIKEAQEAIAALPVLYGRSPDELLGYDEWGLPH